MPLMPLFISDGVYFRCRVDIDAESPHTLSAASPQRIDACRDMPDVDAAVRVRQQRCAAAGLSCAPADAPAADACRQLC